MPVQIHEREGKSKELLGLLDAKLGRQILSASIDLGDAVISIAREGMLDFFRLLKLDAELQFSLLSDITAVDRLDETEERFEVVYHLVSLPTEHRLRIKIAVGEDSASLSSITSLWAGANYLEREVWDMYGIAFEGHPDLRRILMYDEFKGFPLRKDYPVQGKQPRIPLRHPEVENTARLMKRPLLVQISRKKDRSAERKHGDMTAPA